MFQAAAKRMNTLIKRSYSTLPEAATRKDNINASSVIAVRLRQARKTLTVDSESDALPS
jgi:hypothetical protein